MVFRNAPNATCQKSIDYLEENISEIKDDRDTDHINRWINKHGYKIIRKLS